MNDCSGFTWNERFLPRLTTEEIRNLPKENSLLILPIGSIEQHGAHLPIFTDSILNGHLLCGALELLPPEASVWTLPPLYYGKSNEHNGFPGTFSFSTTTLYTMLMELIRNIHADHWKKLLILNSHGGNAEILQLIARDARLECGLMVFIINTGGLYDFETLPFMEREYGIHGGALETSLLLALKPEWVKKECYAAEYPDPIHSSSYKLNGDISFSWRTRDISKSGVIGDPTLATPEMGKKIYENTCARIANMILDALSPTF